MRRLISFRLKTFILSELVDRETTDPGPEILDDGLSAVKRLDTTVEFGSDSIDDLDVQQIPAPLQTPSNGASKIINNAEKASYLQQVVRCLEHSSGERLYTSFWDFAGQSGYYSTHQAFLSPASVYILVVSLQKEINEVIEDNIDFNLDASQRKKMTVFGKPLCYNLSNSNSNEHLSFAIFRSDALFYYAIAYLCNMYERGGGV